MELTANNFISELKNPFDKNCIEVIRMRIDKDWHGNSQFRAYIEFKNGSTSGEQSINAVDFVDLVKKVEEFIKNL